MYLQSYSPLPSNAILFIKFTAQLLLYDKICFIFKHSGKNYLCVYIIIISQTLPQRWPNVQPIFHRHAAQTFAISSVNIRDATFSVKS